MTLRTALTHIHCQNCGINQLCLPYTLDKTSLEELDSIIERKRPYQKGEILFSDGEPLLSLFAVRSGSIKSYILNEVGDYQITNFHMPGDLIGFTSIAENEYQGFAEALETSMVCEIPFQHLETLSQKVPTLQKQVLRLMSEELNNDKRLLTSINSRSAESRMATFFIELSSRFEARGLSPIEFRLSMTRAEIGNYLGITVETVSRIMSKLQKQSSINVEGRLIQILDKYSLQRLAGIQPLGCSLQSANY